MPTLSADEFDAIRCLAAECEADPELLLARLAELHALRKLHTVMRVARFRPLPIERAVNRLPEVADTAAWRAAVQAGRANYEAAQLGTPDLINTAR